jgi:hypothetical protein
MQAVTKSLPAPLLPHRETPQLAGTDQEEEELNHKQEKQKQATRCSSRIRNAIRTKKPAIKLAQELLAKNGGF